MNSPIRTRIPGFCWLTKTSLRAGIYSKSLPFVTTAGRGANYLGVTPAFSHAQQALDMPAVCGECFPIIPLSSFGERTQGRYRKVRPLLFPSIK